MIVIITVIFVFMVLWKRKAEIVRMSSWFIWWACLPSN